MCLSGRMVDKQQKGTEPGGTGHTRKVPIMTATTTTPTTTADLADAIAAAEANQKAPTHYWHIRKAIDTAKYSMDRLEEVWDSAAPSKRADITAMHPSIVRELRDLADRLESRGFGEAVDAR